ncbi:2-phosphoxylose phosphatase 1 isoform X1 [Conger conger]|uniref:2-phosphoxylose phosphatase 1 isoform X1 n=2 Tax=Conger conger TaxID=82655 RepID=UPI002A59FE3F|nr:2-phosphoxylose phosphatase 1 isoform X1 [Conger conger]XP_061072133.1 2-phosphoxylose phosphatase 1 isoform X1 [Conger conger]XP_061072134.1 2-phosphoxylose phosphatase 1 isoform X1 [Conger conger]
MVLPTCRMKLAHSRFILLLVLAAVLAIVSFSLQFLHLIPTAPVSEERPQGKSRKRVIPVPHTEPPEPDPVYEAYAYCNIPNRSEQGWEGHGPAGYKLLSVQVMIRHGDRYPLYAIPKTKRPAIDCTLAPDRKPSHPKLGAFIRHMARGGQGRWDAVLGALPRLPNHSFCEIGELTQTGVVQHLRNGETLHSTYIERHQLLPAGPSGAQLYLESTGKSRTLQSGLALLYGLLPDFDWARLSVRHQWYTLFCGGGCDCPQRARYLAEEQRRQYRLRAADALLERTYADMARAVGVPTRQLRVANPIDSLLCHFCHGLSFPCGARGCVSRQQFLALKRQQMEDERDRLGRGLYLRYALLAAHPFLNRTAARMQRAAQGRRDEPFALYSAHDVTVAPVLSALGLARARAPRFAARLVFELWREEEGGGPGGGLYVRVLYDGEDVTFHTSFCRAHDRASAQPLCPFHNFLSFVQRDMFGPLNTTSYHDACHRRTV